VLRTPYRGRQVTQADQRAPTLLDVHATLTPADQYTHHRYRFDVPPDCIALRIHVRYAPKRPPPADSLRMAEAALIEQTARFRAQVGEALATAWAADQADAVRGGRVANLLTITLDDADGAYRGAGHRHSNDQQFSLTPETATPGLVAGPLPAGTWALTRSAHTLVMPQCAVDIQIGAETAATRPKMRRSRRASRTPAWLRSRT
jgi:hypothetical protein